MLIFHVVDERDARAWQSGLYYGNSRPKTSLPAVRAAALAAQAGTLAECAKQKITANVDAVAFGSPSLDDPGMLSTGFSVCCPVAMSCASSMRRPASRLRAPTARPRAGDGAEFDRRAAAGPVRVRIARLQMRQARDGRDALQHRIRPRRSRRVVRRLALAAAAVAVTLIGSSSAAAPKATALHPDFTAVFSSTSYAPSSIATLRVITPVHSLDLQILRAGAERAWSSVGRPWGPEQHIRFRRLGANLVRVRLGAWTSGTVFRATHHHDGG